MVQDLLREIKQGKDTRQALIKLKELLRGEEAGKIRKELLHELDGDYGILAGLLKEADPKVRKNAALVMGELPVPGWMQVLWEAYCKEETRFVRGAYLKALKAFDYGALVPEMKEALKRAGDVPATEENRKHLQEEKMLLRELVQAKDKGKPHQFCCRQLLEVVLTTNRNHKHVVMDALETTRKKEFNAGVILQTKNPEQLYDIRCFEEMFFVLPECRSVPADPVLAAEKAAGGGLHKYLLACHEDNGNPFYFRIEIRSGMPFDKKAKFARKMAAILEEATGGALVNSVGGYEVELRLVENKNGEFNLLLKLFTLRDYRFEYRRKTVSTGIRPVNAALCIALAAAEKRVGEDGRPEGFFKEGARVLDPFCGAGTMLVERAKYGRVKGLFGLDIMQDAVEAAKENAGLAGSQALFLKRDFFKFATEQMFDEVVTDMPFLLEGQEEKRPELRCQYQNFFQKIPGHLLDFGTMMLYTHDRDYVREYAPGYFRILKELEISMKEGSYLFLLQKRL